jgi:hypothetical protein
LDCGEYATAAKLEVGHSGAPLYQMIGAFFAMFASDNKIALMVNMMSVFSVPYHSIFILVFINHLKKISFSIFRIE